MTSKLLVPLLLGGTAVVGIAIVASSGSKRVPRLKGAPQVRKGVLVVHNWRETLAWATRQAKLHGKPTTADAAWVLRELARQAGGAEATAVMFPQFRPPNTDEWADVLARAKGFSWGAALDIAERKLAEREANEKLPKPPVDLPPQEGGGAPMPSLPFDLIPQGAGETLQINNLRAMLPYVLDLAKKVKANNLSDARGVIDQVAKLVTNKQIRQVALSQLPNLGAIPWGDVRGALKSIPWGGIKPIAQGWLASKGIG